MPAGGSAAALAGALAAALGQMVITLSAGKKDLLQFNAQQKAALQAFMEAQQVFTQLMVDDQAAFASLMAARRLPEQDPDRCSAHEAALLECIRVPQALAAAGLKVLETCDQAVEISSPPLLPDLAACADLSMAAVRTGVHLVKSNSQELSDPVKRAAIETVVTHLLAQAIARIQHLYPRICKTDPQA